MFEDGIPGDWQVILVEDGEDFRALLREFLEALGYKVTEFSSAISALEAFRSSVKFSGIQSRGEKLVVICDNQMPQLDGLSFLNILKSEQPQIPFILMTAFGNMQTEERAKKEGAFGFIRKPFSLNELAEVLKNAFHQKLRA